MADTDKATPDEPIAIPGYRNYLVYCDESGQTGKVYYGFGSIWIPWERRGDFARLFATLRTRHKYTHEIKWNRVAGRTQQLCCDLIAEFFRRNWLMFHCIIGRKGYIQRGFHRDGYDEALRKQFALLIRSKIEFFSEKDSRKVYHIAVDPLPSHYKKAGEAAHLIINHTIKRKLNFTPIHSFSTRDSSDTPGIQLADLLLGAVMADWNGELIGEPKRLVKDCVADHLGWRDLHGDTRPWEWKFNIWYFHDPTAGKVRESRTRYLNLKFPVPPYRRRRTTTDATGSGSLWRGLGA